MLPAEVIQCQGCSTIVRLGKNVVQFLDLVFCNVNCFGKHFSNRNRCDFCRDLTTDARCHVLQDSTGILKFCDSLCLEMHKATNNVCWICSVSARGGSRRNSEFCSHRCEKFFRDATGKTEDRVCHECKRKEAVKHQVKIDYKTLNVCSDECLKIVKKDIKLRLKKCIACKALFENHTKHFAILDENGLQLNFCNDFCKKYFAHNFQMDSACAQCGLQDAFYKMIKVYGKAFCSISCLFNGKNVIYILLNKSSKEYLSSLTKIGSFISSDSIFPPVLNADLKHADEKRESTNV